ncbi:MAG: hypothetical protein ACHQ9S_15965 [Candidatus Binatia bacterium]
MANAILALGSVTLVKHTSAATHMDFAFSIGVPFFGATTGVRGQFYGLPAYARPVYAPPAEES